MKFATRSRANSCGLSPCRRTGDRRKRARARTSIRGLMPLLPDRRKIGRSRRRESRDRSRFISHARNDNAIRRFTSTRQCRRDRARLDTRQSTRRSAFYFSPSHSLMSLARTRMALREVYVVPRAGKIARQSAFLYARLKSRSLDVRSIYATEYE